MALTATQIDLSLVDEHDYEIVLKPISPEATVERACRWSALVAEHPPPEDASATTRKVWAVLLDMGVPITTKDLATILRRHRGNIDRALTPLRVAGLVLTDHGLHRAVPENCRR